MFSIPWDAPENVDVLAELTGWHLFVETVEGVPGGTVFIDADVTDPDVLPVLEEAAAEGARRRASHTREARARSALTILADRIAQTEAARLLLAGELSEEEAAAIAVVFPPWLPGVAVEPDDLREFEGKVYVVIQGHTTQADWPPSAVPALFRLYRPDPAPGDGPTTWEPGLLLAVGEVVEFEGRLYSARQAHTSLAGWEPPAVPALFEDVGPAA